MGMGNAEKIQRFLSDTGVTDEMIDNLRIELKDDLTRAGYKTQSITDIGDAIRIVRFVSEELISNNFLHNEGEKRVSDQRLIDDAVLTIILAMQAVDNIDHSSLDTKELEHWTRITALDTVNGSIWGFYHDREIQHAVTNVIGDLYDVPKVYIGV